MEAPKNIPLSSTVGNAVILLRDWGRFGLEERSLYHFDLSDALLDEEATVHAQVAVEDDGNQERPVGEGSVRNSATKQQACGFKYLLECIPKEGRLRSDQKRKLKSDVKALNAKDIDKPTVCYQPARFPLKISPASTIFFAYETTRIAFVLDASPTMTTTYGYGQNGEEPSCCPLDRLAGMARTLFQSLIKLIQVPTSENNGVWRPKVAVSVLAVFPRRSGESLPQTLLLVRDFRVVDEATAQDLTDKMKVWAFTMVEQEISRMMARRSSPLMEHHSTLLSDLVEAGDTALTSLGSSARPVIVIATDGRAVVCEAAIGIATDAKRIDVPMVILDLSSTGSHIIPQYSIQANGEQSQLSSNHLADNGFPLHLSDDMEALYRVCKATGGCMFDKLLLDEAAASGAGLVQNQSVLFHDQFFSYKRHVIHPNGVQWYILFSLSPLTPTTSAQLGRLPPPIYLRQTPPKSDDTSNTKHLRPSFVPNERDASLDPRIHSLENLSQEKRKMPSVRSIFATYFVNPVRPKGLIVTRLKEGYRAKQYGSSTLDPDKVSVQFILPIDSSTTIHYELSYRAMPGQGNMVGFAHIKIELSGEVSFIQRVKSEFLTPGERHQPLHSRAHHVCQLLHDARKGDMLVSHLSPVKWSDQLSTSDTPFIRRLRSLNETQKQRYFRPDAFDVVVAKDDSDGIDQLLRVLSQWATQTIMNGHSFVKRFGSSKMGLPAYSIVDLECRSECLFSLSMWTFAGTNGTLRLLMLKSLKQSLTACPGIHVLPNQVTNTLVWSRSTKHRPSSVLELQCSRTSWVLVKDPELVPLLIKRRTGIGGFLLLESGKEYCHLAKLVPAAERGECCDEPGDLVQYELHTMGDEVVVDLHMESEGGIFRLHQSWLREKRLPRFAKMVENVRKKDQECSRALHCRTMLLSLLEGAVVKDPWPCVKRLLGYALRHSIQLRSFVSERSGTANDILLELTRATLLGNESVIALDHDGCHPPEPRNSQFVKAWFLIEHTANTISMACLSPVGGEHTSESREVLPFCELVFFPVQVGDLYSRRDDLSDTFSGDTPRLPDCVVAFMRRMERLHQLNYSSAAYLALRSRTAGMLSFDNDEVNRILEPLEFVEVCSVVTTGGIKLRQLVATKLGFLADGIFYVTAETTEESHLVHAADDENDDADTVDDELDDSVGESEDVLTTQDAVNLHGYVKEASGTSDSYEPDAPLFAQLVGFDKDDPIPKRVSISLSVFDAARLPASHILAARELTALLNSFVAEQSLERLRRYGQSISDADLRFAISCLRQARNAAASSVEVFFYVGKLDAMVLACEPGDCGREIEEGFSLMFSLLLESDEVTVAPFVDGGFLVLEKEASSDSLAFFCFIRVSKSHRITIQVYHPLGYEASSDVVSMARNLLSNICHRTNQSLLLQRLHVNRFASTLLIPPLNCDEAPDILISSDMWNAFPPGAFQCPLVFEFSFEAFHRCVATLPQVARTVESTVLHPFTISNDRTCFVYKDESDAIFYMKLVARASQIVLMVFGISQPCTSVTSQLTGLIQKKLLQIAVDMLSSLFTKNSSYAWKKADLDFVEVFGEVWAKAGSGSAVIDTEKDRVYSFAGQLFDPIFVMLFFRQNLCGSSFFHVLNLGDSDALLTSQSEESIGIHSRFYFNNAPATLDPKLQPNSTLTAKGAEYARIAGTGLAIIDVTILNGNMAHPASPTGHELAYPLALPDVDDGGDYGNGLQIKVKVTSTALRHQVIHDWIKLTLNQVFRSLAIERHIAQIQAGLAPGEATLPEPFPSKREKQRLEAIDTVVPGLPALQDLLDAESPHPAILKSAHQGMIRSSAVSSAALEAVDTLVHELVKACPATTCSQIMADLCTIRITRGTLPERCRLSWDDQARKARVEVGLESGQNLTRISDNSVDSPEYVFLYLTPALREDDAWMSPLKLFEGVAASGEIHSAAPGKHPNAYRRSLAFILSVKRDRRLLFAYNWQRQLFKTAVSGLVEKEKMFFSLHEKTVVSFQRLCLKDMSPMPTAQATEPTSTATRSIIMPRNETETPALLVSPEIRQPRDAEQPSRRAKRPMAIRRPKLIGVSVEGSAAKALAASRQRASSNLFKGGVATATASKNEEENQNDTGLLLPASASTNTAPDIITNPLEPQPIHDYISSLFSKSFSLTRMHGKQNYAASQCLADAWLPNYGKEVLACKASLLFSSTTTPLYWSEVVDLFGLPTKLASSYLDSFARTICLWVPGLQILGITETGTNARQMPVFLSGAVGLPSGRTPKCQVLIRLSQEGRTMRSMCKFLGLCRERNQQEMDTASLSKLAGSLHRAMPLDRLAFDYFSSLAELSLKSLGSGLDVIESVHLVKWLCFRRSLCYQVSRIRGSYKVFSCTIDPASYDDSSIDDFGAPQLFRWMLANKDNRSLMSCGEDTILLTQEIVVRGTCSLCLVSCDIYKPGNMNLFFLCRSEGRNVFHFTFQEGSCVAMSVMDRIAVSGAGLLQEQLCSAAVKLRLQRLWKSLSQSSDCDPSRSDLRTLLDVASKRPLDVAVVFGNRTIVPLSEKRARDRMFHMMEKEAAFSPSWPITDADATFRLLYIKSEDVFILLSTTSHAPYLGVDIVCRDTVSDALCSAVAQKVYNYFMLFIWTALMPVP